MFQTKILAPIYILVVIIFFSCSNNDEEPSTMIEEEKIPADFSMSVEKTDVVLGEAVEVTVQVDKNAQSLFFHGNSNVYDIFSEISIPEDSRNRSFLVAFDKVGEQKVKFTVESYSGLETTKELVFNVTKGNAHQIKSIEIKKFFHQGTALDKGFSETDEERLADLQIILDREIPTYQENRKDNFYFKSQVFPNESNLVWDLESSELYLMDFGATKIYLTDVDETSLQDHNVELYPADLFVEIGEYSGVDKFVHDQQSATYSYISEGFEMIITYLQ